MADTRYFYSRAGQQYGPVSGSQLKQLAAQGQIEPNDFVWREGGNQRVPARNVRGLFQTSPQQSTAEPPPVPTVPPSSTGRASPRSAASSDAGIRRAEIVSQSHDNDTPTYFPCPHCKNYVMSDPDWAGQMVQCPHCANALQMPAARTLQTTSQPLGADSAVESGPDASQFPCPHCKNYVMSDPQWAGQAVQCPHCNNTLRMPMGTSPTPTMGVPIATPISSAPETRDPLGFLESPAASATTSRSLAHPTRTITPKKSQSFWGSLWKSISGTKEVTEMADGGAVRCPKCGCTSIAPSKQGFDAGMGCLGALLLGPLGVLCGACSANTMYSVCMRCGHKWKIG